MTLTVRPVPPHPATARGGVEGWRFGLGHNEHLFVGELVRHLWLKGAASLEVLKPQVDDAGYDVL